MPESRVHMALVRLICQCIRNEYFDGDVGSALRDAVGLSSSDKPPPINGYIPDAYAWVKKNLTLLGEAKTELDLENKHTFSQLTMFVRYCSALPHSVLLIAVPWHCTPLARNILQRISKRSGLNTSCCRILHGTLLE